MLDLSNEDFNREYDKVCKDFEKRLYNERLEEWLKYHDDSEGFPGVDMNALLFDDLCRLSHMLMMSYLRDLIFVRRATNFRIGTWL